MWEWTPYLREMRLEREPQRDRWLRKLPVVRQLREQPLRLDAQVTVLAGENGMGKSTLLEAVAAAWGFNPEGGSVNFSFSTRDSCSELVDCVRLVRVRHPDDGFFLRAESFYNAASYVEQTGVTGYGARSLHEQSHGESFLALAENRLRGGGLYILDEPEAALSPARQLALLALLHDLAVRDSQIILATHSPILMAYPGARIYELGEQGAKETALCDTANFKLYRQFLDSPERTLHYLLED